MSFYRHHGKRDGKRVQSISCYFDGINHCVMLATNPTEAIICNGNEMNGNQAQVSQGALKVQQRY
jgi:hypothetical protein